MDYDFSELPNELQREYMLYLPVTDIANYCNTNLIINEICKDDYFWYLKLQKDFPEISQYKPEDITYQQQYLDLLSITDPDIAAEKGRLDILTYLYSQRKRPNIKSVFSASKNGNINLLEWLENYGIFSKKDEKRSFNSHEMFRFGRNFADTAAETGHINVLEWLEKRGYILDQIVANFAAAGGRIDILDWLEKREIIPNHHGLSNAAIRGHIDVLEWFVKHGIYAYQDIISTINTLRIDILEWLEKHIQLPYQQIADNALQYGMIKILDWVEKRGFLPSQQVINDALIYEREETVEWLRKRNLYSTLLPRRISINKL